MLELEEFDLPKLTILIASGSSVESAEDIPLDSIALKSVCFLRIFRLEFSLWPNGHLIPFRFSLSHTSDTQTHVGLH